MQAVRFSVLSCLLTAAAGCGIFNDSRSGEMTAEKIVEKMELAAVPRGATSITTAQITMERVDKGTTDKDRPEMISIANKAPDKIRFMTRYRDKFIVKGWDGRTGWEYSSESGYRLLKGAELDEIRFQGAYTPPWSKPHQVFSKIILEGVDNVDGRKCWKLLLTPDKKYNSQDMFFHVDKNTGLLLKTEEIVDGKAAAVQVETIFVNYRNIDGVMLPESMVAEINGNIVETRITNAEWNIPVDDLMFAPPASLIEKK